MASAAKTAELKARFRAKDKNGDGKLDFNEFLTLMVGLDTKTAHRLFEKVDSSGDGTINFDEFVDYIYSTESHASSRTTAGRHAKLAAASAVTADTEDAALWPKCERVFDEYQGIDEKFEGKDLLKLCKDCKLFDRKFTKPDVDIVFSKHKPRGKNTIDFEVFKNCLRGIAQKKMVPTSAVQAAVGERADIGMEVHATKADYVRFHDDKTTYTGSHTANENHGVAVGADVASEKRKEKIKKSEELVHDEEQELPWEETERAFYDFCKGDSYLDGREFSQLCTDADLFVKGSFETAHADIVFNKVKNRGERKIEWAQFKDACISIAAKRGGSVAEVQIRVCRSSPQQHGVTKADAVRFHDDKSTYTGMHAAGLDF